MNYNQTQVQKQILKFSPQQIQLLNLLQLNSIAIEQRIKDEIEENPALEEGADEQSDEENLQLDSEAENESDVQETESEIDLQDFLSDEDIPFYKLNNSNSSVDDDKYTFVVSHRSTFQEQLKDQIISFNLSDHDKKIANYIIDSLDEDGYLRTSVSEIANYFSFAEKVIVEEEEILNQLKIIQQCDPPGVGARTLQECLILQLERKNKEDQVVKKAIYLMNHYFREFSNKNYEKIIREAPLSIELLQEILKVITHLNPKPVSNPAREESMSIAIIPEFQVFESNGIFDVVLTNQQLPELRLSKNFLDMIEQIKDESKSKNKKDDKSVIHFARQKINSAKWFIDAIKQRQNSMLRTMETIVKLQHEFFLTGDFKKLKPMILKDVAQIIKMDISTISRVTSNKYVQTPFGVFKLKIFFTSILKKDDGEEISNKEIQEIISEMIEEEDKKNPLTDMEISHALKDKGYITARRTVAKYREYLGIPIARMRKELINNI